jgi:hypothetical protein
MHPQELNRAKAWPLTKLMARAVGEVSVIRFSVRSNTRTGEIIK